MYSRNTVKKLMISAAVTISLTVLFMVIAVLTLSGCVGNDENGPSTSPAHISAGIKPRRKSAISYRAGCSFCWMSEFYFFSSNLKLFGYHKVL